MGNGASAIKPYKARAGGKKEQVADMFDNISGTYDVLNRVMTMGIDTIWRKKAIRSLRGLRPQYMLDVATGTGDFAIESLRILNPRKIIGVDISAGMLEVAREKIERKGLQGRFEVLLGDSERLSFEDGTFDAVTVAFGVRNFENLERGLADIHRVLKPGGRAVILELSNPKALTPAVGRLVSRDSAAYSYLPESVANFPDGDRFADITEKTGFRQTKIRPQTFGFCTIYECTK